MMMPTTIQQGGMRLSSRIQSQLNSKMRTMSTLVLSEPIGSAPAGAATTSTIPAATCSAVAAAQSLHEGSDPITLLVVGSHVPSHIPSGVSKVLHYESSCELTSEVVAMAVADAVADDPDVKHVLGASTKFGASIVPRVAAMLQVSPITDVVQILSPGTFVQNRERCARTQCVAPPQGGSRLGFSNLFPDLDVLYYC